jgi:transmembrane sensor
MSDILKFPNARRIREAACTWVGRIDRGLTSAERTELEAWLAESPQHRDALMELGALWDEMGHLSELAGLFPLRQSRPAAKRKAFRWRTWSYAVATVCLVVAVGFWASGTTPEVDSPSVTQSSPLSFETGVGEQTAAYLDDGSVVTLNTNTLIEVQYSASRRTVVLKRGEANFDVAHDPMRPFSVYAGSQVVQAIGTVFNVHLAPSDEIEVAVTEGRVRVLHRAGGPERPLSEAMTPAPAGIERLIVDSVVSAGQVVIVEQDISTLKRLAPEDIDVELAWQRGMLIFRGEPLEAVLREVGRYTTVDFELADETLASVRVGGYFRVGEIDGLLLALRENFGIQASRSGQTVVLQAN